MKEKPPILELKRSVLTRYKEYPLLWVVFAERYGMDYGMYIDSGQLISLVKREDWYALVSRIEAKNDIIYEITHAEGLTLERLKDYIFKEYKIKLMVK
jgi:hypothetical protein